ncbi:hypothetical protein [Baekduia sp.]|uniref:hypothetical protein n=1 Tax=Baekduia sp. TaxID=2600305 RepID=UPI002E02C6FC|nr:hypothetical protein [Baekduia sp.]
MKTLEEVTYEAGRAALADQEAMVGGIRQRTGTLLAAQALVASFLGGTAIKDHGFHALGWLAVLALLMGLVVAAVVLAPWRLKFAVNARDLYEQLYRQAREEADLDSLRWLAAAGFGYQDLRLRNAQSVRWLSRLSAALSVLMVMQTVLWLLAIRLS